MIAIATDEPCALDFTSWVDAILSMPIEAKIKNWNHPQSYLEPQEVFWLNFLYQTRCGSEPGGMAIKAGRGIGAWYRADFIILLPELITNLCSKYRVENEYGNTHWTSNPRYIRMRPFMENKRRLLLFYKLFNDTRYHCGNTYITCQYKKWAYSIHQSQDFLEMEITNLRGNKKIIHLPNSYSLTELRRHMSRSERET